jgi:hypothetical protein
MPIDTVKYYNPKMKEPAYVKITTPHQNSYDIFKEYEIRIRDEENGEEGPYNYMHEAVLIAKTECEWSKVPDILKAYVANTRDVGEALKRIHPRGSDSSFAAGDEVVILVFLRSQLAKDLLVSGDLLDPRNSSIGDVGDYES